MQQDASPNDASISKKSVIVLSVLSALTIVSFYTFTAFSPKALSQVSEVQGLRTDSRQLPVPYDSEHLSEYKTDSGYVVTVQTSKTIDELKSFFENGLRSKDWRIDNYGILNDAYVMKFKKSETLLNIAMVTSDNKTTVTLEVNYLN